MFQIDQYQDELLRLHDHVCPRQVIGLRMGELAGEILGLRLPQTDKRLFVFVETDGCFADGVMLATGCSLGHRTMRLRDNGKVAAIFVDTRAEPCRAVEYVTTAQSHWHTQLAAYQIMPVDELLCASPVELEVPIQSIISRPGVRAICAVCGEEIINEREVVRGGITLCRSCTIEGRYYRQAGEAPGSVAAIAVTRPA